MRYRIIKKTHILYEETGPVREVWYVLQYEFRTILTLWIPLWFNMHFDDYAGSIMTFDTFEKAERYTKKLRNIQ